MTRSLSQVDLLWFAQIQMPQVSYSIKTLLNHVQLHPTEQSKNRLQALQKHVQRRKTTTKLTIHYNANSGIQTCSLHKSHNLFQLQNIMLPTYRAVFDVTPKPTSHGSIVRQFQFINLGQFGILCISAYNMHSYCTIKVHIMCITV